MATMLIPQTCCYHGYALQPFTCMICSMVQVKLSTGMPGTSDFAFSYYPAPDLLASPVGSYHYKPAASSPNFNCKNPVADMFKPALPKLNTAFGTGSKRSWVPIGDHDNGCESFALSPVLRNAAMMLDEDHADQFAFSDDEEEPQRTNALRRKYKETGKKENEVEVLAPSDNQGHPKVKFGRGPDKFPRKRKTIGPEERKKLRELMEKIKGILSDEDPEVILGDEDEGPGVILGDEEPGSPPSKVQESIQPRGRTTSETQDEESNFTEFEAFKRQVSPRARFRTRPSWLPPHAPGQINSSRGRNFNKDSRIEPEPEIVENFLLSRAPKVSPQRGPSWLPPRTPAEMDPPRGRKRKQQAEDKDDGPCLRRSTRVRR
jgi:hypothetical protein